MKLFTILAILLWTAASPAAPTSHEAAQPKPVKRLGFYLHACWTYDYPFAARSWARKDYDDMYHLLRQFGYNTVMLWPVLETVPMPLSAADKKAVEGFRSIIDDARRAGLECWLTQCPNLTSQPEIATKPWRERDLMPQVKVIRLVDTAEAEDYWKHRAKLLGILNNADGYVTIDGDPGGYAGAKPEYFRQVFVADRQTLDRVGTHPKKQKVIPWIWCGWGTKGVWQEPITPFVRSELELLKHDPPPGMEYLMGQCRAPFACRRINVGEAQALQLTGNSTLMCYESVEFEPSAPSTKLQFQEIRSTLREESGFIDGSRGVFCNAQTPILVIPNMYFFARSYQDPNYLNRSDDEVLRDLSLALGGPPELLIPAWRCLELDLTHLPADLPARLRNTKLTGKPAKYIPGSSKRYLNILAGQVEARIGLLRATQITPHSNEEAAAALTAAVTALVGWWQTHHYVFDGAGDRGFRWAFVEGSQVQSLKNWCRENVKDKPAVKILAVNGLLKRKMFTEVEANQRISEMLN